MSDLDPYADDDLPVDRTVKVPHLVFGLFFLGVAASWALVARGAITIDRLALLGPAVLIVAGVIGLAASLANNRNRHRRRAPDAQLTEPVPDYTADHTTDPVPDSSTDPTQENR